MSNKKGILLTLLVVVLFLLMVGELIFYIALNTNYNILSQSAISAANQGSYVARVNGGMGEFLHTGLFAAVQALARYASTPSIRHGNFITNTSYALQSLMMNGTVYGANMSSSMGSSVLTTYISALEAQASAQSANLIFVDSNIIVYQTTPYALNVTYTGTAIATTSYGTYVTPITVNSSVNLNGLPDLLSAEEQQPSTIYLLQNAPKATVIGNITAQYSSTSPFQDAAGTVILMPGAITCTPVASQYKNANYILATPDALSGPIPSNICGMGGIVTCGGGNQGLAGPQLIYTPSASGSASTTPCGEVFNSISNGTQVLIDGPAHELLNVTPIQSAITNGYYFPSPYAASYLQRGQANLTQRSPAGIASFNLYSMQTNVFNGQTSYISAPDSTSLRVGGGGPGANTLTLAAWIEPFSLTSPSSCGTSSAPGCYIMTKVGSYQLALDSSGDLCWIVNAITTPGFTWECDTNAYIQPYKYYQIALTYNGTTFKAYVNGNLEQTVTGFNGINYGSAGNQQPFDIGSKAGASFFQGRISDVMVYNSALPGNAIWQMYVDGVGAPPIANGKLAAWYPLNKYNYSDYSGNGNTGTPTAMTTALLSGYTGDPLIYGPQPDFSALALTLSPAKSQYVTVPGGGTGFATGDAQSSMFGWVYPRGIPASGSYYMIMSYGSGGALGDYRGLAINGNGNLCFEGYSDERCDNSIVKVNAWNFVGYTYLAGASNTVDIFLNGNNVNGTLTTVLGTGGGGTAYIGSWSSPPYLWNGSIMNLQVYSAPVNVAGAGTLYQEGISGGPVTTNTLVAWWPLNGNVNDYSTYNNNGAPVAGANYTPAIYNPVPSPVYGLQNCLNRNQCSNASLQQIFLGINPLEPAGAGFENESVALGLQGGTMRDALNFSGSGVAAPRNLVSWMYAQGSQVQTKNTFSMSIWVYPTKSSGTIVDEYANSGTWHDVFIDMYQGTGYVSVYNALGSTCLSVGTVPLNQWSMITSVYNGITPGTQTSYLNGVQVTTVTVGSRTQQQAAPYYVLGESESTDCPSTAPANTFVGKMADWQFFNYNLTSGQVLQLYDNDSTNSALAANMLLRLNGPVFGLYNQSAEQNTNDNLNVYAGGTIAASFCKSQQVLSQTCYETWSAP